MAKRVRDIMNSELFSLRPETSIEDALGSVLAMGITAAPILADDGKPLGMVSLRDLVQQDRGDHVEQRMSRPVATVGIDEDVQAAGKRLADAGVHRLVVVDEQGRATGVVAAVDLVRGLLGLEADHPAQFPHLKG
jgi:predicted transcriptional regulator